MSDEKHAKAVVELLRAAREDGMGKTIDDHGLDIVISASNAALVEFAACAMARKGREDGCVAKVHVRVLHGRSWRPTGDGSVFLVLTSEKTVEICSNNIEIRLSVCSICNMVETYQSLPDDLELGYLSTTSATSKTVTVSSHE
jgi:hypothetical protein